MNLQDLMNGEEVSEDESFLPSLKDVPRHRLSILSTPLSELYSLPDFYLDLEIIEHELNELYNKSVVVYDRNNFEFKGISQEQFLDDSKFLQLKRNVHSVFLLLVYGFSKAEIMEILKVSRSYISLLMENLKIYCYPLLEYRMEMSMFSPNFTKF